MPSAKPRTRRLKSLTLENFTVFHKADLKFGSVNVIIGENGSGKTHILKAAYAGIAGSSVGRTTKAQIQLDLADKLIGVFKPDALGRLVRRAVGRLKCTLAYSFHNSAVPLRFTFGRPPSKLMDLTSQVVPAELPPPAMAAPQLKQMLRRPRHLCVRRRFGRCKLLPGVASSRAAIRHRF